MPSLATLDQMAAYKMNKLHLHLTDDEGWRSRNPRFTRANGCRV
ncbi:family 20 glycosylhydrolase [Vibrio lentus]|nr:family 20 glycosylhydrolase [Vibrio lentus]